MSYTGIVLAQRLRAVADALEAQQLPASSTQAVIVQLDDVEIAAATRFATGLIAALGNLGLVSYLETAPHGLAVRADPDGVRVAAELYYPERRGPAVADLELAALTPRHPIGAIGGGAS